MSSIFGGGGGSQPAGNTINVTQAENPLTPYVSTGANSAQNALNNYSLSPFLSQAWNATAQRAGAGSPSNAASTDFLRNAASGQYLDPGRNPYFQSAVNDSLGLAKSQFTGMYGGAAGENVNNSGFQEGLTRNLGQLANNAYAGQFNQQQQQQMQAASLLPQANAFGQNMDYQNLAALSGVGQAQNAAQFYPSQQYAATLGALPGAGGTSSTSSPYFTNPAANALGLGLGAMSLYGMGSQSGLWSGIGDMFGGGAAGMGGAGAFMGAGGAGEGIMGALASNPELFFL